LIEWSDSGRHRRLLLSLSVLILDQYVPREWVLELVRLSKKPAGVTAGCPWVIGSVYARVRR
jgi:hypothetical protein